MGNKIKRIILILSILVGFYPGLSAEDKRTIPLDVFLIIDDSEAMKISKNDVNTWINGQIVDRILIEGDQVSIWRAGDTAELIHSGPVSAGNPEIKEKLANMACQGKKADFSGALRAAASSAAQTPQNRLAYTLLVTASVEGLALNGNSSSFLKWSRSEKSERWQVLVLDPNIGSRVQQAARNYMSF